ncbi:hypothetical protein CXB51_006330 [Gossypium anomalum]|uniref:NAC domain-containing protein n=1 Tax=Gossypium anomalum TaxID=47600 RepID=A0A8J6D9C4_9ROSI|nr:hypothetical protein CXB51_006330 [Gossypium anomalum]
MLNSSPVPHGYQFRPSRQEIFIRFLFPIVYGECLPSSPLIQVDIYGENKEPWNIFDKNSKTSYWVFTKLKKKSKLRIDRTAGSGCWLARNTKEVYDDSGKLLGYHKYFTFSCKNDECMNLDNGHWIMHEFSLKREDSNDSVICEIRNKNAADSDSDSKLNTKKRKILSSKKNHEEMNLPSKPNDEEMGLISIFSNSDHKDLSSDLTFETRNKNYGLDLNLNLKLNDENMRFYVNHEDPKIIYKDVAGSNLNSNKLELDDEEMESISRFSNSNHKDLSSDVTFGIGNRNDSLGLNLNLKSNDEDMRLYINHEDENRHYLLQNIRISDDSPLEDSNNFDHLNPISKILNPKPNHEEIELILIFTNSIHNDLSSDVTFYSRNRNDGLDLNLNFKYKILYNHEDSNNHYTCKVINKDVVESRSKIFVIFDDGRKKSTEQILPAGLRSVEASEGPAAEESTDEGSEYASDEYTLQDMPKLFLSSHQVQFPQIKMGIRMHRFYFKCTNCFAEMTMKTDPQNKNYVVESGATRNFEHWRAEDEGVERERERETEKKISRNGWRTERWIRKERLTSLQHLMRKSRHATVSVDSMLEALQRTAAEKEKKLEEEDEALIKSIFQKPKEFVRRISDDVFMYDGDLTLLSNGLNRRKVSEESSSNPARFKSSVVKKKPKI